MGNLRIIGDRALRFLMVPYCGTEVSIPYPSQLAKMAIDELGANRQELEAQYDKAAQNEKNRQELVFRLKRRYPRLKWIERGQHGT